MYITVGVDSGKVESRTRIMDTVDGAIPKAVAIALAISKKTVPRRSLLKSAMSMPVKASAMLTNGRGEGVDEVGSAITVPRDDVVGTVECPMVEELSLADAVRLRDILPLAVAVAESLPEADPDGTDVADGDMVPVPVGNEEADDDPDPEAVDIAVAVAVAESLPEADPDGTDVADGDTVPVPVGNEEADDDPDPEAVDIAVVV